MDDHWWIQIIFEVAVDKIDIVGSWLDQIDGSNSMKLFSVVFDMKIQCDIVFPQIFHFE